MPRTIAHFLRNVRGRVSLAAGPVTEVRDTSIPKRPRFRSRLLAGLTASCLCLGLATPAAGAVAPVAVRGVDAFAQEPEVLRVRIQLDASACGDEAGAIESRVSGDLEGLFLELSVLPGGEGSPVLELVIKPFDDPENPGYAATLAFVVDGERVEASAAEASCALCTHGELAASVSAVSREAIERARAGEFALEAEPASDTDGPEGPEPEGPETPPVVDPVKSGPLGPLGFGGIAATVLGAGALGGGAALLAKGDEYIDGGLQEKRRRGPGVALVGVGVGALITGVALIVVDRVRAKKAATR